MVPWLVLGLALAVTVGWWSFGNYDRSRMASQREAELAGETARRLEERLVSLEQLARSVAATVAHGREFSQDQWRDYVASVGLYGKGVVGAAGAAYAPKLAAEDVAAYEQLQRRVHPTFRVWPASEAPWRFPLELLAVGPGSSPDPVLGFDAFSNPSRRDVIERALARRDVVISEPLTLRSDNAGNAANGGAKPGLSVMFAAPVTRPGELEPSGVVLMAVRLPVLLDGMAPAGAEKPVIELELPAARGGAPIIVSTGSETGDRARVRSYPIRHGDRLLRLHVIPLATTSEVDSQWGFLLTGMAASAGLFLLAWRLDKRRRELALRMAEALERADKRFHALAQSAPFLVWTTDPDINLTFINAAWQRVTGAPESKAAGKGWLDFVEPADHAHILEVVGRVRAEPAPFSFHGRLRTADGSYRWMAVNGEPVRDGAGHCTGFMGAVLDVQEMQAAAQEREAAARLFSDLLDAVPMPVSVKDENHRFVFANEALCAWMRRPREEIVGRSDLDIFGESGRQYQARDREALAAAAPIRYDVSYRPVDNGGEMIASVMKSVLRRETGGSLIVTAMLDMTGLHRLAGELEGQRRLLDAVLNALPFPVAAKSRDHRFLMINDACLALNGWTRDAVLGRSESELRPPEFALRMAEQDDLAIDSADGWRGEENYVDGRGEAHWTFKTKTPVTLTSGERVVVVAQMDLTERRRAELALERERAFLDAVIDGMPAMVFVTDRAHRNVRVNAWGERFVGRRREELVGRDDRELGYDPQIVERNIREDEEVFASGQVREYETELRDAAGEPRWLLKRKLPITLSSGEKLLLGVAVDITEQRRQTVELEGSRQRLQLLNELSRMGLREAPFQESVDFAARSMAGLFEGLRVAYSEVDASGTMTIIGSAGGMGADTLAGQRMELGDRAPEYLAALQADEALVIRDMETDSLDPAIRDLLAGFGVRAGIDVAMPDAHGGMSVLCVDSDVPRDWTPLDVAWARDVAAALAVNREAQRARALRDAALSEVQAGRAFLDAIIDALPQPLFVKDRAHRLVVVNQALCDWWSLPRDALIGRTDADLMPESLAREAYAEDDEVFERGSTLVRDARARTSSGPSTWVTTRKAALRVPGGDAFLVGTLSPIDALKSAQERAEAGERFLEGLLDAIPQPVFVKDRDHRWIRVNSAFAAMMGMSKEQLIGRTDVDVLGPAMGRVAFEEDDAAYASAVPLRRELQARTPRGPGKWVLLTKIAVRLSDREQFVVGVASDIHELKTAQQAAEQNERFVRQIVDAMPVPMVVKDQQGQWVLVNDAYVALTGWNRDRLLGRTDREILGEERGALYESHDRAILAGRKVALQEERFVTDDGRERWFLKSREAITDVGGRRLVVVSGVDITERRRAEQEVARSRLFLDAILNAIPNYVYVKDTDGHWLLVNDACAQWLGTAKEAVIGLKDIDLLPEATAETTTREDAEVLRSGSDLILESQMTGPGGRAQWFLKTKTLVADSDGSRFVVGVSTDITERKRSEIRALASSRRLALLNDMSSAVVAGTAYEHVRSDAVRALGRLITDCAVVYWTLDDEGKLHAASDAVGIDHLLPQVILPPSLRELRIGERLVVEDGEASRDAAAVGDLLHALGARSLVALPIGQNQHPRAMLSISSAAARHWRAEDIDTVSDVARALASALSASESRLEREAAERALRESKMFVDALLDALPQGVYVKDEAGRWIVANEAFCRIAVRPRHEVIGRSSAEIYPPDKARILEEQDRAAFSSGSMISVVQEASDPRSPFRWQLKTKAPVVMPDGSRYLVCTAVDITELKLAQIETERVRGFLHAVLDATPLPIFVKDSERRMVIVNAAAAELLQRPRESLIGLTDFDIHEPEYAQRVKAEDDRLLVAGGPEIEEVLVPLRGAGPTWVLKHKAAITLPSGER